MGGEEGVILPHLPHPPIWFSLNNSKTVKAVIGDIRAQFGIHNLPQSSDIGQTSDRGISDFRISAQSLMKENCHSSRTSDEIDMKLGKATKLDKRNKTTSKKIDDDVCWKIVTSSSFFGFLANLQQSGGRIPDTESGKLMFSVIVTYCLTNYENRTKKSLTQLSHYCFEERFYFGQNTLIFWKKCCYQQN